MAQESVARLATVQRVTTETDVSVRMNLDGSGSCKLETGLGFLNHMLELFARHGSLDLDISCKGDLQVDEHHSVEDIGITLGEAVRMALGDKSYIARYGHAYIPMDESLVRVVVDFSGRFALHFDASFSREKVGDLPTELVRHFWHSFAEHASCNLHITVLYGENNHHQIEAIFKATARAIRDAVARDYSGRRIPSTKGAL